MATYQNDFKVKNSIVVRNTATISTLENIQTVSYNIASQPTLNLNFLNGSLDPRITFTRASGATVTGPDGYIKYVGNNTPRFDYSSTSTGACLGLLLEEARTNYFQQLNGAGGGVIGKNMGTSVGPDNNQSHKFTVSATTSTSFPGFGNSVVYSFAAATGTVVTVSFTGYFGASYGNQTLEPHIVIQFNNGGGNYVYNEVQINTTNWTIRQNAIPGPTVTQVIAPTITQAPGGMYKVSYTIKYTDDGTLRNSMGTYIQVRNTGTSGTYSTDGTSGIQYACLQTEVGAFPTSYIPTETTSVTRAPELTAMSGQNFNNWYNQSAGTFYVENDGTFTTSSFNYPRILHVGDGSVQSNTLQYLYSLGPNNGSNISFANWYNGAFTQAIGGTVNLVSGDSYKSAFTYSLTQLTGSIQGSNVVTASMSQLPTISNQMGIGGYSFLSNSSQINGHMKRVQYWPTVLSSTQLTGLTTTTTFADKDFASSSILGTGVATTANFVVKQGVVVGNNFEAPDIDKFYITNLTKPTQQASLNLNFLRGVLDPRISFTRASGATVIGPDGYIKYVGNNTPRFDYSSTSTGTCLGLLIEEQRTNLALYSGQMIPSLWSYGPNSTYIGTAIAPDGSSTAASVTANGSGGNEYVARSITYSSSTVYTASVWARLESGTVPASGTILTIGYSNTSTTTTSVRSVINYNGNLTSNWQRFSTTFTNVLGGTYSAFFIADQTNTSTIQAWGAQIEQGNFVTSYIPTGSATATRASDLATMSGQNFNSWINPTQGTLYLEADAASVVTETPVSYRWPVSISTGGGQKIGFHKPGNSIVAKIADDSYVSRFEPSLGTITTNTTFKVALSYSSGNQFAAFNYVNSATGTTTVLPKLIDNLRIGNGDAAWCGHIRRVVYYPEQLSNTVTQSLTVI